MRRCRCAACAVESMGYCSGCGGVHHKSWLPRAYLQGLLKRLQVGFGAAGALRQPPVDHTSGATSVGQDF